MTTKEVVRGEPSCYQSDCKKCSLKDSCKNSTEKPTCFLPWSPVTNPLSSTGDWWWPLPTYTCSDNGVVSKREG